MAETKTYKGKKQGLYPLAPGRHDADLGNHYVGPFDYSKGPDLQNAPDGGGHGQFGRKDGKSEAD